MYWPYLILDLPEDTTDAEVRKAYQRKVRECPPEKDAERFSAIQQAYEQLRTEPDRVRLKLFGLSEKPQNPADLVPDHNRVRENIPMEVWLKELNS